MQNIKSFLTNEKKFNFLAKRFFDNVDTDGSGEIDVTELTKAMKRLATEFETDTPEKEDINDLFDYIDADKSGKIEFEEFKQLVRDILTVIVTETEKSNYMPQKKV